MTTPYAHPTLRAEQPTEAAVRRLAGQLLARARRYEDGIRSDRGPAALHHYRVSLRKCRSLLNLTRDAFVPGVHAGLKSGLAAIAEATGLQRDLDVFLLARKRYAAMLPEALRPGIAQLFEQIATERAQAHLALLEFLDSSLYRSRIERLLEQLREEPALATELAHKPIGRVAGKMIRKRYRRIARAARSVHADTPDATIHALRIDCKKLRYLLELFGRLFEDKAVARATGRLRTLQDTLGEFNDFSVQQRFLLAQLPGHDGDAELSAAIGGLVAVLHARHLAFRQHVEEELHAFAKPAVGKRFRQDFRCG